MHKREQKYLIDIDWRRWHLTSFIPYLGHFKHDLSSIYKPILKAFFSNKKKKNFDI